METTFQSPRTLPIHRIGGAAFMLGNLLFVANKIDEMSRLFFGRYMADVISGDDRLLIVFGQVLLIAGYMGFRKTYLPTEKFARIPFNLFVLGGMIVAVGHTSFMNGMPEVFENLFILILLGMALMVPGLILFGISNLRKPVIARWKWLPLFTGLMGFTGFFLFSGEEITPIFLTFRTLFALGLIGLGFTMWLEKPVESEMVR